MNRRNFFSTLALGTTTLLTTIAHATSFAGTTVYIHNFSYGYWLGNEKWDMICTYRINDGAWMTASTEGDGQMRSFRIPETSVTVTANNGKLVWSHGEEIRSVVFSRDE